MTCGVWQPKSTVLIVLIWPLVLCKAFSPQSKAQLSGAVRTCLRQAPEGDCYDEKGPIRAWDLSYVTDMSHIFSYASAFNGDLSKWDVSSVTDANHMFYCAAAFNGDISKWDVSRVTNMRGMFNAATAFNVDISTWDVSRVTSMNGMFFEATGFKKRLSGAPWVNSQADRKNMFEGSRGSISKTVRATTNAFSSKTELTSAVDACHIYS